jgi:AcrR family transcriptional regulator
MANAEKPAATKGARTRQQLLAAAAAEIALHGRNAKMADVAGRIGLSQPAVYRHFKNRDEVHDAVVGEFRERLRSLISSSLIPPTVNTGDVETLTALAVTRLMQFLNDDRDAMTVALLQEPEGEETRQELIAMIAANVEQEIAAGFFRTDVTPVFFATCLVGIVTQFARQPISPRKLKPTAETIAAVLLKGIEAERK